MPAFPLSTGSPWQTIAKRSLARPGIVLFLLISCACARPAPQYSLDKDSLGRIVRLDLTSGEVFVLTGETLVKAKTEEDLVKERNDRAKEMELLLRPKEWPPHGSNALRTAWREGEMYVRLQFNNPRRPEGSVFSIRFYDADGFELLRKELLRDELVPAGSSWEEVDTVGRGIGKEPSNSYEFTFALQCSSEVYRRLSGWAVFHRGRVQPTN
jgi:hypothetical protein